MWRLYFPSLRGGGGFSAGRPGVVGGGGGEAGRRGRPPAAFAADEDVFAAVGTLDRHGLDDAQLADGIGQLVERLLVELRTGVCGVGDDVRDGDFGHLGHRLEFDIELFGAEDGVEPAS